MFAGPFLPTIAQADTLEEMEQKKKIEILCTNCTFVLKYTNKDLEKLVIIPKYNEKENIEKKES